jgi:hypothetical protein
LREQWSSAADLDPVVRRKPFGLLSSTLRVLRDELMPLLSIIGWRGEIEREQATQNRFPARVEGPGQRSQDVILPGCRSSFSSHLLRTEQEVSRDDRRSGNIVAEDLDILVVVLGSLIDVADCTAIQEDVREFMSEGEDSSVNAVMLTTTAGNGRSAIENPRASAISMRVP